MNVLIITIGNSEIQVSKNPGHGFQILKQNPESQGFQLVNSNLTGLPVIDLKPNRGSDDSFLLSIPRQGGKCVNDHYKFFSPVLQYPLISPLLEYLKNENLEFHEVWWVYTDQEQDLVDADFKKNDTLYFKSILQKYFDQCFKGLLFKDFPINNNVKDIDAQYKHFYAIGLQLSKANQLPDQIFLLPQGGIDQINHALTLQLIQLFKDKVHIFQSAEKSKVTELQFTKLFLEDLTRQNIIKHLKDFDFDKAAVISITDNWIKQLCTYATLRLNMKQMEAFQLYNYPTKEDRRMIGEELLCELQVNWNKVSFKEKNKHKLTDLIVNCKILFKQEKYNEGLIKLFTVFENFFKILLEIKLDLKDDISTYHDWNMNNSDINEKWVSFLNNLDIRLVPHLQENGVWLSNPSRLSYWTIYSFLTKNTNLIENAIKNEQLDILNGIIENFSGRRNGIAHNLKGISKVEVEKIFRENLLEEHSFFDLIDQCIGVGGFGVYKKIQEKILVHYGQAL